MCESNCNPGIICGTIIGAMVGEPCAFPSSLILSGYGMIFGQMCYVSTHDWLGKFGKYY